MATDGTYDLLPKKEVALLNKEYEKLNKYLSGIRTMTELPKAMIIVDPSKEYNAIREARKLNIPVFGIVDTNCDPDMVDYVIPGNDDAVRAVKVVLNALTNAIATVNGNEIVDVISEDDKTKEEVTGNEEATIEEAEKEETEEEKPAKKVKKEKKVEEKEEEKPKKTTKKVAKEETKEEVKEEKKAPKAKKEDLSSKTLTELKEIAKEKGIKGYSKLKKEELLEVLK
jgi:small subunit ribosomal protein S2